MKKELEMELKAKRAWYSNAELDDFLDSGDEASEKCFNKAYVIAKISGWEPVLITGPNGTGKSGYAKLVWNENPSSNVTEAQRAKNRPEMLSVNCSAFSENLIACELFGYKKGAFTGANEDHKGKIEVAYEEGLPLFLDEIGDLPLSAQAMLLRFLQNGEIQPVGSAKPFVIGKKRGKDGKILNRVKVICATNKNLEQEVLDRNFREDFFNRINKYRIEIPSLCERPNDCRQNFINFFNKFKKSLMKNGAPDWAMDVDIDVEDFDKKNRRSKYKWPGNFRELQNALNQAIAQKIIDGDDKKIGFDDLFPNGIVEESRKTSLDENVNVLDVGRFDFYDVELPGRNFDLEACLHNLRKICIEKAKRQFSGNKTKAATLLGYKNYQKMDRRLRPLQED